ncbi:preprotein translocase subunit SecA [Haliangium ochraceum]|uniref:Protein translocase subunit SecA n=1 Tax=Haliangium ochraceum (strain DSM 14365 / JCM 11303 / SMP-2) TaxID=502025 RepID=D0LXH0_HALO1|nr:preprotein translocase subunit SecA [Haliangium ochraceum]ACY17725.1 preprotein translocase, SecA subunit [Haliangium ochraceum DSM 14365]
MGFIEKLFGSKNDRDIKKLRPLVQRIGDLEPDMKAKSDAELQGMTAVFKERLDQGASLDDLLPEAFATVREAGWRVLGMRHFDVQLIGGMILHRGKIAEMRTGEGKTLVATLPAYLNALPGRGVHVVTVNDYLARRDAAWMGRLYGFLGLEVGVVIHGLDDYARQRQYNADITYGQNNEFGFDYLRDNMKMSPDRMVQRHHAYAIVDEVDSILIDEARTPLIISGPAERSADLYKTVDRVVPKLKRDIDFTVDEKAHSAMLTDAGVEKIEELLDIENLYDPANIAYNHHVAQSLRAHTLYKRDVNYLVQNSKIVIVDEHTGRTMPGRRWSDGLHQAIEAKEGVKIEEENQTLATITFQNYFRLYDKLSGMTGTADTEAPEFHQIYKLDVTVIPTNKPIARDDAPDLVYKNERGKFHAVIDEIKEAHEKGQPVLVGTVSVEKSEVVANQLKKAKLPFHVLNAKHHQSEASIVAQAGRKGSITISTNMAGRGTDIVLGGNAEAMAKDELEQERAAFVAELADKRKEQRKSLQKAEDSEALAALDEALEDEGFDEEGRLAELLAKYEKQCSAEREEVLEAGGLKIVGTERHESRRIDNQLRGRAGRQGDPGASRFYLSLEDDLLRIFNADFVTRWMERLGMEEDVPIESGMVTRAIEKAQKQVEGRNFDMRKNLLEYDDVMNQQRKTIYGLRRQILEGRYAPELSDEERKAGKTPEVPTESGDWTVAKLEKETQEEIQTLVTRVAEAYKAQHEKLAEQEDEDGDDLPPLWRVLRHELWRTTGTLCDVERLYGKAGASLSEEEIARMAASTEVVSQIAASLVQQRERLYDLCDTVIGQLVDSKCPPGSNDDDWALDELQDSLREHFHTAVEVPRNAASQEEIAQKVWGQVERRIDERIEELGRPWLLYFVRHFFLEEIDQQWVDHLKTMDQLREGIGLRGYGQKDPKKEYKKEGFDLFGGMMERIQSNVCSKIFRVQIRREEDEIPELQAKQRRTTAVHPTAGTGAAEPSTEAEAKSSTYGDAADGGKEPVQKQQTVRRDRPKVGRNDPCPCGSGKKYKKCHGRPGAEASA